MKDSLTRQLNMAASVIQGLDNFNPVWSGNTKANDKHTKLSDDIGDAEQAVEDQQANSTGGEGETKTAQKHNMAVACETVSHGICLYALDNELDTIYNQFNKSATAIENMKDVDCLAHCNAAKSYASGNSVALAGYDVDGGQITGLSDAISAFGTGENGPSGARAGRHSAVLSGDDALKNVRKDLLWWDHYVGGKKISNPDLYNDYHSRRKIVGTGVHHVSIRTFIFDSATTLPLYLVKITASNATISKVVKSGKTGRVWLFSLPQGTFSLTIEAPGYQTQTINNVGVIEGKITNVANILLVKA